MARGFFERSIVLGRDKKESRLPECGACGLYKKCSTPKLSPYGKGKKKVLVIHGVPEDREGITGTGSAWFKDRLISCGVKQARDCWTTYSIICHTDKALKNEVGYCRANLRNTIKELNPEMIIPVGEYATQSLMPLVYKDPEHGIGSITRWVGWTIPCRDFNTWICPVSDPAWVIDHKNPVALTQFDKRLRAATELIGARPHKKVTPLQDQIEVVTPKKAAKIIRKWLERGWKRSAFDYETNCLKPDFPESRLVSNAICFDGKQTIAYMMTGPAVQATRDYLTSPLLKIGANMKFEDRWSKAQLGVRVQGWETDTINVAHALDNRPQIASVKFQALVLLGVTPYDTHIKPLLSSRGDDRTNQILKEIDPHQLLIYNGMDALVEWMLAEEQTRLQELRK